MSINKPVRRIAIVGTGVIGASWAAEFLAHGFDVLATDPAPNAEQNLRKYIDAAWPALTAKGLEKGASHEKLSFSSDLKKTYQSRTATSIKSPRSSPTLNKRSCEKSAHSWSRKWLP